MTDSHCHLDSCDDPAAAADPSLAALVTVGTSVESNERSLRLAATIANVWAAVGIHPNDAGDAADEGVRDRVEEQARGHKVVAVGETGFDTHWDRETLASQRAAFEWHAGLAIELDLPLILHVRDRQGSDEASSEASRAIREAGHRRGVLHCCNGNQPLLETALELDWLVSFAGNLTYPSAEPLREAARLVPLDRLMVETDSPYLAPAPKRGKRNLPTFVRHTAERLAQVRGETLERIEECTDANARRFYRFEGRNTSADR
ncbi:MAG TPA: TatD family hydrolase [Trueperaceae bacterium]